MLVGYIEVICLLSAVLLLPTNALTQAVEDEEGSEYLLYML